MKKYLKTIVMIILVFIIFSSFAVAVEIDPLSNKISNNILLDYLYNTKLKQINNPSLERGYVMFSQRPYLPNECWTFYISAKDAGYLCQDDFWNLTDSISDVHWWGVTLIYDEAGWILGSPNDMEFEIIFYEDNSGTPGNIEITFSNITPTYTDTQLIYADLYKLYYFQTDISTEVSLVDGWISIQSTSSPDNSWLLLPGSPEGNFNALQNGGDLIDNLAFNLTTESLPPPDIICNGSLFWDKVKAGSAVNGTFQVCNNGDLGSLLNWTIDTYPEWGTWTFTPNSGVGLTAGDCVTIMVEVIAPPEKNGDFAGTIKIINSDDPTDFCEIDISLTTPRVKTGFNLLQWILQKYPNMFPILRHILA